MKRISSLFLSIIALSMPAVAEPVVIELFASQNCAACPKAFKNLNSIRETEDIFVLTWSVDYWDYLATADPMALPESKERQAAYVERFGLRGPYTPQTVYDGTGECRGTSRRKVREWIEERKDASGAKVSLVEENGRISISGDLTLPKDILLVHYLADYTGEMPNPVTKVEKLGGWNGGPASFSVACETACAVLVQDLGIGEIHAVHIMP